MGLSVAKRQAVSKQVAVRYRKTARNPSTLDRQPTLSGPQL